MPFGSGGSSSSSSSSSTDAMNANANNNNSSRSSSRSRSSSNGGGGVDRRLPDAAEDDDDVAAADAVDVNVDDGDLTTPESVGSSSDEPTSLEGNLLCRKGRASLSSAAAKAAKESSPTSAPSSNTSWRKRFVYLDFRGGGSITVYRVAEKNGGNGACGGGSHSSGSGGDGGDGSCGDGTTTLRTLDIHRAALNSTVRRRSSDLDASSSDVAICIPASVPWIARDVRGDRSGFVVEVPTSTDAPCGNNGNNNNNNNNVSSSCSVSLCSGVSSQDGDGVASVEKNNDNVDDDSDSSDDGQGDGDITADVERAREKGKPLRVYFRCCSAGSGAAGAAAGEKALWLQAFSRLGRLSSEARRKRTSLLMLPTPFVGGVSGRARKGFLPGGPVWRTRQSADNRHAGMTRQLALEGNNGAGMPDSASAAASPKHGRCPQHRRHHPHHHHHLATLGLDVEELARGRKPGSERLENREFRVEPAYTYPHRWLTKPEMKEEMVMPSETYHDLRVPGCKDKEIGNFRVEVLQCLGLPKLDQFSETDAVVYLVCGQYAFATDTVDDRANPMWLRKSRRACDFPIFHGYAKLYVGVFDEDDGVRDEFAGRVVVDLSRLRPQSTYDVTLPLRLSTHVYSRRGRGAIRLRFTLTWSSDRDFVTSYLPKGGVRIPPPQRSKPNLEVTVKCADQKAFHNIAVTVHGTHMPGKFTFQQMRAAIREVNYTRKCIVRSLRDWIKETRQWRHPAMSAFIFAAWMHSVYSNSVALVPAYAVTYTILILMSNYGKYGTDRPNQRGFVPPSWEELLLALIRGGSSGYRAISPLELKGVPPSIASSRAVRRPSIDSCASSCSGSSTSEDRTAAASLPWGYEVKTHKPQGSWLFHLAHAESNSSEDEHLEFPFGDGSTYPKFTVKESLVYRKGDTRMHHDPETFMQRFADDMQEMVRADSVSGLSDVDPELDNFDPAQVAIRSGTAMATGMMQRVTDKSLGVTNRANETARHAKEKMRFLKTKNPFGQVSRRLGIGSPSTDGSDSENFVESSEVAVDFSEQCPLDFQVGPLEANEAAAGAGAEGGAALVDPLLVMPQQNVDVRDSKKNKKIADELAEARDKVHDLTWHQFDDRLYTIKRDDACFFGQAKKAGSANSNNGSTDADAAVAREIERYMRVGQYSHANPLVARVGGYVEPLISSAYSILCLSRAGFNAFTWRDPVFTFWLSILLGALAVVLFVFPWRMFFFAAGFALVGPQNWILRILRERGRLPPERQRPGSKNNNRETKGRDTGLPDQQPIFKRRHREEGNASKLYAAAAGDEPDAAVDEREVHHVVVPYGPLIYQRFYDWPPEPQYAHVTPIAGLQDGEKGVGGSAAAGDDLGMASSHSLDGGTCNNKRRLMVDRRAALASMRNKSHTVNPRRRYKEA